jgi:hypothetical protein
MYKKKKNKKKRRRRKLQTLWSRSTMYNFMGKKEKEIDPLCSGSKI